MADDKTSVRSGDADVGVRRSSADMEANMAVQ